MQLPTRFSLSSCLGAMLAIPSLLPTKASILGFEGTNLSAWRLLFHNQASDRLTIGLFALIRMATLGYTLNILLPSRVLGVLGLL